MSFSVKTCLLTSSVEQSFKEEDEKHKNMLNTWQVPPPWLELQPHPALPPSGNTTSSPSGAP